MPLQLIQRQLPMLVGPQNVTAQSEQIHCESVQDSESNTLTHRHHSSVRIAMAQQLQIANSIQEKRLFNFLVDSHSHTAVVMHAFHAVWCRLSKFGAKPPRWFCSYFAVCGTCWQHGRPVR